LRFGGFAAGNVVPRCAGGRKDVVGPFVVDCICSLQSPRYRGGHVPMGSGSQLALELTVAHGHYLEPRTTAWSRDDAKVFPANTSAEHWEARSRSSAAQRSDASCTSSKRADAAGDRDESSPAESEARSEAAPKPRLKSASKSRLKSTLESRLKSALESWLKSTLESRLKTGLEWQKPGLEWNKSATSPTTPKLSD